MGTIATAYVQVMPSTQGIAQNLEDQFTPAGETAGKKAGLAFIGKFGKALVAAGAVKAVKDFFKASVKQGAKLQQNLGGVSAVFGKASTDITSRAKQAYKNMGLSASEYMATANKMGALFQGSGLSQVESMKLTTKAMQRAADVASVMGLETSSAMEAIAGAAKGNFTMMDNLGVAMNATTLQAYALEKGINFDWNTASQAEKSQLAMEMFFDRTSQYAGNFARESEETISGSLGMLKASWADFLANLSLGGDVLGTFRNVFNSAVAVGENILPAVGQVFLGLVDVAKDAGKAIGKTLGNAFTNLKSTIKTNAPELYSLMDQTWSMVSRGAGAAWNGIKTIAGDAWSGLQTLWSEHGGQLQQSMSNIWTGIQTRWQGVLDGLSAFWDTWGSTITSGATSIWNNVKSGFEFGFTMISDAFSIYASAFAGDWEGAWEGVKQLGSDAWDGITKSISGAWSSIKDAVSPALDGIKQQVASGWEKVKSGVIWQSISSKATEAWNAFEGTISGAWSSITGAVSGAWQDVMNGSAWASISSKATEAWNAFEGTVSGAWSSITGAVSGAWQDVMNGSAWASISSKATEAWNAFEGTISGAFKAIGSAISEAWETVKGAVSFQLPDFILGNLPRLPKISITGSFSLSPLSVPTISWNKKGYEYPLLFTSPTVIPTAAGLQGFGDGHGAEVVMSLAKMREMVGLGDNGGVGAVDYEILATLQELRGAIEHMGVYLDGKSLVGGIINQVDSALGERDALTQRGIA